MYYLHSIIALFPILLAMTHGSHAAPLVFGPAAPVAELNVPDSSRSRSLTDISPDGLSVVVQSNFPNGANFDLYRATRPDLNSPFSGLSQLEFTPVNGTAFNISQGVLSDDGLELFYHHAASSSPRAFFRTTRASTAASFSGGSEVSTINQPSGFFRRPSDLSSDSLRLYYYSDDGELHLAERPDTGTTFAISTFDPFININSPATRDIQAFLTPDELGVYFASDRPGGAGGFDIWYASRPTRFVAFQSPTNVSSLNTAINESVPIVFGEEIFFNRGSNIFSANSTVASVPEPTSLALLATGAFGFMGYGWRRKRKPVA